MTPQHEWAVPRADAGVRLDKFLAAPGRLVSRRRVSIALERGQVFLNDKEADLSFASRRLSDGDVVRLWMDRPGSARRRANRQKDLGELKILYEDDAIFVVNKPPGLLSVPLERKTDASSVQDFLVDHLRSHGKRRPFVVHRIDRDTSGLVVFAKDSRSQHLLKDQFRRREAVREYWAVVYGRPAPPSGVWRDRLVWDERALIQKETHPRDPGGMDAVCRYRTLETYPDASLIEIALETGKRNQIRIQARLRGHTLVGEKRYVYGPATLRSISFERQALHARRLSFRHPADNRLLEFEAPVPADLADLIARLRRA